LLLQRYFGYHNFVGRPIASYRAPKCIVTRKAAASLAKVQSVLLASNMSLKVYDCYRPTSSVDDFVVWAKNVSDTVTKAEFYPGTFMLLINISHTHIYIDG
jgi:D-alanyl-D-alanine dipeptidase